MHDSAGEQQERDLEESVESEKVEKAEDGEVEAVPSEPPVDFVAIGGAVALALAVVLPSDVTRFRGSLDLTAILVAIVAAPSALLVSFALRRWSSRTRLWVRRLISCSVPIAMVVALNLVAVQFSEEADDKREALIDARSWPRLLAPQQSTNESNATKVTRPISGVVTYNQGGALNLTLDAQFRHQYSVSPGPDARESFMFAADVTLAGGAGSAYCGLFFALRDDSNWFSFGLSRTGIVAQRDLSGTVTSLSLVREDRGYSGNRLTIVLRGDELTLYLNEHLVLSKTLERPAGMKLQLGAYSASEATYARCSFSNIEIRDPIPR